LCTDRKNSTSFLPTNPHTHTHTHTSRHTNHQRFTLALITLLAVSLSGVHADGKGGKSVSNHDHAATAEHASAGKAGKATRNARHLDETDPDHVHSGKGAKAGSAHDNTHALTDDHSHSTGKAGKATSVVHDDAHALTDDHSHSGKGGSKMGKASNTQNMLANRNARHLGSATGGKAGKAAGSSAGKAGKVASVVHDDGHALTDDHAHSTGKGGKEGKAASVVHDDAHALTDDHAHSTGKSGAKVGAMTASANDSKAEHGHTMGIIAVVFAVGLVGSLVRHRRNQPQHKEASAFASASNYGSVVDGRKEGDLNNSYNASNETEAKEPTPSVQVLATPVVHAV
jgi:hypothetical protein